MNESPPIENFGQEQQATQRGIISFDDLMRRLNIDRRFIQKERRSIVALEEENRHGEIKKVNCAFSRKEWKKPGFNATEYLKNTDAPLVEVAGPTPQGYTLVDVEQLKKAGKALHSSNLFPGLPWWKQNSDEVILGDRVAFQSDATQLSVKDGSVGAFFCSYFGYLSPKPEQSITLEEWKARSEKARLKVIEEARRVLQENGLLIWQGGRGTDVVRMAQIGFEPIDIAVDKIYGSKEEPAYHAIFRKPIADKTKPQI